MCKKLVLLIFLFTVFSCRRNQWYRTKSGLLFKEIRSGSKDTIHMGMTVKLNYIQRVGDSIMDDTYDKVPLYYMVMPRMSYYNPLEVFDYIQMAGDSIVTKQRLDSMLKKKIFKTMPPWMNGEDEWITTMKIEKVFSNDSLLQLDKIREQRRADSMQQLLGIRRVENFLRANKVNYKKYDPGVYVQILSSGNGPKADSGKFVSIRYKITNLRGKVFDSNIDTSYHHPDTLSYVVQSGFMMRAADAAISHLHQGDHALIYIPTMLAFGGHVPQGSVLHPYDDLIFEVYLLNVSDKRPEISLKTK